MRREVKFRPRLAFRVPWWRDCKVCGLEFFWERAWVVHRLITATSTLPVYVCRGCADSREDAGAVFADLARSWNPFGPDYPRAAPRCPPPPPPPVHPRTLGAYEAMQRREADARPDFAASRRTIGASVVDAPVREGYGDKMRRKLRAREADGSQ